MGLLHVAENRVTAAVQKLGNERGHVAVAHGSLGCVAVARVQLTELLEPAEAQLRRLGVRVGNAQVQVRKILLVHHGV